MRRPITLSALLTSALLAGCVGLGPAQSGVGTTNETVTAAPVPTPEPTAEPVHVPVPNQDVEERLRQMHARTTPTETSTPADNWRVVWANESTTPTERGGR